MHFIFSLGLLGDKWLNNATHVLKMIFTFQCSHKYAVGDETMHILSHYVRADATEHDLDRCTVFIAYRGALLFNDTRPKCKEYSLRPRKPEPTPTLSPDINVAKVGHQKPASSYTTWTSYKASIMSDKEIDELWRKYNRLWPMPKLGIPVVKLKCIDNEKNKKSNANKPTNMSTPKGSVNIQKHGIPLRTK